MNAPMYGKRGGMAGADRGARKIAYAYGKGTILTHSSKSEGCIALESASERMVAHMLDIDPEVRSFSAQPFAVELISEKLAFNKDDRDALRDKAKRHGGHAIFYTPDFGVVWTSGIRAALEVKLENYLGDDEYQRKLSLVGEILHRQGCEFLQLVMPSDVRHPLRTNLPLLHQAQRRKDVWPLPEITECIQDLQALGAANVGDYLQGLGLDARMSPVLLVAGFLQADVGAELRYSTSAVPAFGELSHLQILRGFAL